MNSNKKYKLVNSSFVNKYILDGEEYIYKGERSLTDRLFVNELIQKNKIQVKRVLDFKI